jgi:hypothetical protein
VSKTVHLIKNVVAIGLSAALLAGFIYGAMIGLSFDH